MIERKVVIVLARCSRTKQGLGIRLERREAKRWLGTWAFAIKDAAAKKEGYDQTQIKGEFSFDDAYPGCPHCGSHGFFVCSCGKVSCYSGETKKVTCAWCGSQGEIGGAAESLSAGGDR